MCWTLLTMTEDFSFHGFRKRKGNSRKKKKSMTFKSIDPETQSHFLERILPHTCLPATHPDRIRGHHIIQVQLNRAVRELRAGMC